MQEQEDVFDLEGALAEPGILALVELFSYPCLQITVFILLGLIFCFSSLLCCICGLERAVRHLIKAQEVLIELVLFCCFTDGCRLDFILSESEFVARGFWWRL